MDPARAEAPPALSDAFLAEVQRALGEQRPNRLLRRAAELLAYESDALTAFKALPGAVALPETKTQVIELVRACHRHRVPFVARGSGTSLSGGSLPVPGGLVIGLNRLRRIIRLDAVERIAVVEPGVVNLEVTRAAAPFGLYYAPDPSSQSVCTIGGNVAFNSGGAHCLRYGMTSNHVLGIEAVLPDGVVVTLGGDRLESVTPDTTGLFVGSEGRFGIALEITLRLLRRPAAVFTLLAAYDRLDRAGDAVALVVRSGLLPAALEIMDRLAIAAAEAATGAGYPTDAAAVLIVELEGEPEDVAAESELVRALILETEPASVRVAGSEAERELIWKGRKGAFSAVGRLAPDYIVQDGVVPRSKLAHALREIERLGSEFELRVANVFHAGDGNLHPLILFDGRQPGALERAEGLAGEILRLCIALGGSITGEHGVGVEKRAFLPEMYSAEDLALMRRLCAQLDPYELANRGKMLAAAAAEPAGHHAPPHPLERAGIISRA